MNDEKVEQLIDEVEKRPALFLKNLNDYMDINLKKKLWEEVCAAIFCNTFFVFRYSTISLRIA